MGADAAYLRLAGRVKLVAQQGAGAESGLGAEEAVTCATVSSSAPLRVTFKWLFPAEAFRYAALG
jgi:hypothetical protein